MDFHENLNPEEEKQEILQTLDGLCRKLAD